MWEVRVERSCWEYLNLAKSFLLTVAVPGRVVERYRVTPGSLQRMEGVCSGEIP